MLLCVVPVLNSNGHSIIIGIQDAFCFRIAELDILKLRCSGAQ